MHKENNVISQHNPRECWWCWMFAVTEPHEIQPHNKDD